MADRDQAIQAIRGSEEPCITPAMAAPVIGCSPEWIRYMAKTDPAKLGFRVIQIKSRTKIPRLPFLRYLGLDD